MIAKLRLVGRNNNEAKGVANPNRIDRKGLGLGAENDK
jgi:hypothetical protein